MSRKVKSIRGEIVDFDLIDIKNKIMTAPTPETVHQRERFIDKRRRRGSRKKVDEMLAAQQTNESAVRAAIEEERRKKKSQLDAQPHIVIDDTIVTPPESGDVSSLTQKRRIVKTGG
jgi:hypothetical protein